MLGRPEEQVQLAVKIAIWMLFVLVVAQLYTGATRLQREALIVEAELQRDHRILASTIVAVLDAGSGPRPSEDQISTLLKSLEDAEHEVALSLRQGSLSELQHRTVNGFLITEAPLQTTPEPLVLTLREPLDEVERVLSAGRRRLAMDSFVALVLGLFVAAAIGHRVVGQRVVQLVERAEEIGRGELANRPVEPDGDEIVAVARALEVLAQELRHAKEREADEHAAHLDTQRQLRHADRLRLVGDLAAGVAHELGSPLHVLLVNAEALSTSVSDPDLRDMAQDIRSEAMRMDGLVRQLLGLAHPQPGRAARESLPVMWGQMRGVAEGLVRGSPVELELGPPPDVHVRMHGPFFVQIMANLIRNAMQAQPNGGSVRVTATCLEGQVTIDIDDDGPGVPDELRDRVFAPFFTTKPPGSGVGLGLSVVRGMVGEAGGQIVMQAAPSGGARVRLELPLAPPSGEV